MRIVSQGKDLSFEFENTPIWTQYKAIYAMIGNNDKLIGMYDSEKEAENVFEDIHKAYGKIYTNIEYLKDMTYYMP
jgi:hypothetical protein